MISLSFFRRPMPATLKCSLFFFFLVVGSCNAFAQIKTWTGAAGDGLWNSSANWSNSLIPTAGDDVIIDGSVISVNYTVTLPNTAVTVRTLQILPLAGQTIQVTLPASNLVEPAFTATGPGYGLLIDNGGVFLNASGLTSGESLLIADSIRIGNGAKYIHHTRASHANNIVRLLSRAVGTELGIFEFDVPRSSYTISASNRTYGTLSFSSVAAGGTVTYACNGSNPLTIRGNLRIGEGVSFSVDLGGVNGNILIKGDYIQNGGVFNIASGVGNSTVVEMDGNLIQSPSGLITETNTGLPSIELHGSSLQVVSLNGSLQNSIDVKMNNPEGAVLLSPLSLPYKLELLRGKITTSSTSLLTLKAGCSVTVDSSATNTSYIDGPLRKEGLINEPYFLFPVGKTPSLRWLELKQAVGNFTVEYIKGNPRTLSTNYGVGIDHISAREYWTVNSDVNPVPVAAIELSFQNPESGGITNISTLRVAQLSSSFWIDAGAISNTGQSGFGSVVGNLLNSLQSSDFFTLGSSINLDNPLPVKLLNFSGALENDSAALCWRIDGSGDPEYFEVQQALQDMVFTTTSTILALKTGVAYKFVTALQAAGPHYFKLKVYEKNGNSFFSKTVRIDKNGNKDFDLRIFPTLLESGTTITIHAQSGGNVRLLIMDMIGRTVKKISFTANSGEDIIHLDLSDLPTGIYVIMGYGPQNQFIRSRFMKK